MATSTLRQVLTAFEQTDYPLSLNMIAQDLQIPLLRLEGMIQYWVRKGRIRETAAQKNCGSCGLSGECPFVMKEPRSYELVNPDIIPLELVGTPCCTDGRCH